MKRIILQSITFEPLDSRFHVKLAKQVVEDDVVEMSSPHPFYLQLDDSMLETLATINSGLADIKWPPVPEEVSAFIMMSREFHKQPAADIQTLGVAVTQKVLDEVAQVVAAKEELSRTVETLQKDNAELSARVE